MGIREKTETEIVIDECFDKLLELRRKFPKGETRDWLNSAINALREAELAYLDETGL